MKKIIDEDFLTIFCSEDGYKKEKHIPGQSDEEWDILNKPAGGLWTSPKNSSRSWKDLVKGEMLPKSLEKEEEIKLRKGTKIFILDNEEDFYELPTKQRQGSTRLVVDWDKLKLEYDAFWLTSNAARRFHYAAPTGYQNFNAWDIETIFIFENKTIEEGNN